jgi:subtilisin family serine protease
VALRTPVVIQTSSSYIPARRFSASVAPAASPLDLVKLRPLMEVSRGRAEIVIGLIDGPVAADHDDLTGTSISEVPGRSGSACIRADSTACVHGTFVAGIMSARREAEAPAICPDCTLLVRPIFSESSDENPDMPSASPEELAAAIIDCIDAGARVINLSAALVQPSLKGQRFLDEALDYAARHHVIVVAAAGNQGNVGASAITRHPWVIPVSACDLRGTPISYTNLGNSIGRRGLSAPGYDITSLGTGGRPLTLRGTSAAAPFVTGAIALLFSEFTTASAAEVKHALLRGPALRRPGVVPALLDAWAGYRALQQAYA